MPVQSKLGRTSGKGAEGEPSAKKQRSSGASASTAAPSTVETTSTGFDLPEIDSDGDDEDVPVDPSESKPSMEALMQSIVQHCDACGGSSKDNVWNKYRVLPNKAGKVPEDKKCLKCVKAVLVGFPHIGISDDGWTLLCSMLSSNKKFKKVFFVARDSVDLEDKRVPNEEVSCQSIMGVEVSIKGALFTTSEIVDILKYSPKDIPGATVVNLTNEEGKPESFCFVKSVKDGEKPEWMKNGRKCKLFYTTQSAHCQVVMASHQIITPTQGSNTFEWLRKKEVDGRANLTLSQISKMLSAAELEANAKEKTEKMKAQEAAALLQSMAAAHTVPGTQVAAPAETVVEDEDEDSEDEPTPVGPLTPARFQPTSKPKAKGKPKAKSGAGTGRASTKAASRASVAPAPPARRTSGASSVAPGASGSHDGTDMEVDLTSANEQAQASQDKFTYWNTHMDPQAFLDGTLDRRSIAQAKRVAQGFEKAKKSANATMLQAKTRLCERAWSLTEEPLKTISLQDLRANVAACREEGLQFKIRSMSSISRRRASESLMGNDDKAFVKIIAPVSDDTTEFDMLEPRFSSMMLNYDYSDEAKNVDFGERLVLAAFGDEFIGLVLSAPEDSYTRISKIARSVLKVMADCKPAVDTMLAAPGLGPYIERFGQVFRCILELCSSSPGEYGASPDDVAAIMGAKRHKGENNDLPIIAVKESLNMKWGDRLKLFYRISSHEKDAKPFLDELIEEMRTDAEQGVNRAVNHIVDLRNNMRPGGTAVLEDLIVTYLFENFEAVQTLDPLPEQLLKDTLTFYREANPKLADSPLTGVIKKLEKLAEEHDLASQIELFKSKLDSFTEACKVNEEVGDFTLTDDEFERLKGVPWKACFKESVPTAVEEGCVKMLWLGDVASVTPEAAHPLTRFYTLVCEVMAKIWGSDQQVAVAREDSILGRKLAKVAQAGAQLSGSYIEATKDLADDALPSDEKFSLLLRDLKHYRNSVKAFCEDKAKKTNSHYLKEIEIPEGIFRSKEVVSFQEKHCRKRCQDILSGVDVRPLAAISGGRDDGSCWDVNLEADADLPAIVKVAQESLLKINVAKLEGVADAVNKAYAVACERVRSLEMDPVEIIPGLKDKVESHLKRVKVTKFEGLLITALQREKKRKAHLDKLFEGIALHTDPTLSASDFNAALWNTAKSVV
eukprot:TRINITY_DN27894_c0_g1_i1.p1 TRINITY_DN27894_c0_g1~~TRINITY_DN27894_c0_g1_i1.p1  ORF type:complete len:1180 (+),score=331.14 TRINITY_DN27894_c0_g1_i1:283-3822(+)